MTTGEESHIIRTGGGRFGKGLAIIVIVMAIGAGIHVAYSDFWNAYPPGNQIQVHEDEEDGGVKPTGETVSVTLKFVESSDFRTLGFNAIAGEPNANPDIVAHVGDRVEIELQHGGKMPHAFGVVSDPEDPNTIQFKAAFKSASDPLLPGNSGELSFIVDKEGEYFYICTVPGHALQGMQGKFIVKKAEGPGESTGQSVKPTGVSHTFDLAFTETSDLRTLGFNAPKGETNANPEIRVKAGDTVTINVVNNGVMPHAFGVVSDPDEPLTVIFNSKIKAADNPILKGQTGSVTFVADKPGHYYYICTVPGHSLQGMQGDFIVE
jgi:nitrite reductase (NO-forming)